MLIDLQQLLISRKVEDFLAEIEQMAKEYIPDLTTSPKEVEVKTKKWKLDCRKDVK